MFGTKFINPDRDAGCTWENVKQTAYCTAGLEHQANNFAAESWVSLDSESGADTTGDFFNFYG